MAGRYGERVSVTGEATARSTGWLELQVVGGALIWSKKNGDGYIDTSDKMARVYAGVDSAMAAAAK